MLFRLLALTAAATAATLTSTSYVPATVDNGGVTSPSKPVQPLGAIPREIGSATVDNGGVTSPSKPVQPLGPPARSAQSCDESVVSRGVDKCSHNGQTVPCVGERSSTDGTIEPILPREQSGGGNRGAQCGDREGGAPCVDERSWTEDKLLEPVMPREEVGGNGPAQYCPDIAGAPCQHEKRSTDDELLEPVMPREQVGGNGPAQFCPDIAGAPCQHEKRSAPASTDYCPSQNGENITDASGAFYEVTCDIVIPMAVDFSAADIMDAQSCMQACSKLDDCPMATLTSDGLCGLATSSAETALEMTGAITFKRMPTDTTSDAASPVKARQDSSLQAIPSVNTTRPSRNKRTCGTTTAASNFEYTCTYAGTETSTDAISDAAAVFCETHQSVLVRSGTWLKETITAKDGTQVFFGIHNTNYCGYTNYVNVCALGFEDILDSCSPDGQGNQGGYIWQYNREMTFVIGINGNAPTTFCNGYC